MPLEFHDSPMIGRQKLMMTWIHQIYSRQTCNSSFGVGLWMLPNGYLCLYMIGFTDLSQYVFLILRFIEFVDLVVQVKAKWLKRCSDDVFF